MVEGEEKICSDYFTKFFSSLLLVVYSARFLLSTIFYIMRRFGLQNHRKVARKR